MNRSEHLLFGDRQVGKTMYLIKQMLADIAQGTDAVYIAVYGEPALQHARAVLRSATHGMWGRTQIERHTFSWETWERARQGRRARVYIDDADVLLDRLLARAVNGNELLVATFNVSWPVQAIVVPEHDGPPMLQEVLP